MTARSNPLFNSEKGQSLIEALGLALAMFGFVSVVMAVFYLCLVHVGINYLLHENLVCEATQGSHDCRQEFLTRSRVFLFAAHLEKFESSHSSDHFKNRVEISMPMHRTMRLQKELALYR